MAAQPLPDHADKPLRVPGFVGFFNPIGRRLASYGLMGPNVLLTVIGRKSGLPRTTPVAMVEVGGRRWIIGTFGPVAWVKNLREAGSAVVTIKGRKEELRAVELSPAEGARFFREVLRPYTQRLLIGGLLLRILGASDVISDPEAAARRRPVFELKHPS